MAHSDRIFVAIGVSSPDGGLEKLPGAITAASRMAAWAAAHGYLTIELHDGGTTPVTVDLLRESIRGAIEQVTSHTELQRIVVYFAGHGSAQAVGDQYWMLSNWDRRPTEAVKVSALQRMLEFYGPKQVSIIGDACQEYSARFIDVVGSPVLDKPDEERRGYELDQFFAVDVGKQAFMIKATGSHEAFCLFTEVLLDALEGDAPAASYEQVGSNRIVTSQSLAAHLRATVGHEAGKYGVRMDPRPNPGFYSDRIYATLPPPAPPRTAASDEPAGAAPGGGPVRGPGGRRRGARRPVPASPAPSPRTVRRANLALPDSPTPDAQAQAEALSRTRGSRRDAFIAEVGSATVRDHFETGSGVCVSGASVDRITASLGEPSRVGENSDWYRIRLADNSHLGWSDTLVTLEDGRTCAVCAVQGFVAALHVVSDGRSLSLFHRPIGAGDDEGVTAIDLLGQLHAGSMSEEQIIDLALLLREGKHRVITMGCIAAQFYDAIRDVDSLRQMASFYAQHHQPVPLDIALYGGGTISEEGGRLFATIPPVAARAPRTTGERMRGFSYGATPGFDRYPIAGRIPWMRQAWSAVATAVCDDSAAGWRADALDVMEYVRPGAFTNVGPEGYAALSRLSGGEAQGERDVELAGQTS